MVGNDDGIASTNLIALSFFLVWEIEAVFIWL